MKRIPKTVLWLILYGLLILAPLLILLIAPGPPGREFLRELSVAIGFAGLSLMGLQFIPTARLPGLGQVFPIDTLYIFHHHLSVIGFILVIVHPVLLFINNPYTLRLLNVFTAPWRAKAAVSAVALTALLVITSAYRKQIRLKYEAWRLLHDILAVGVAALALYHMFMVNYRMSVPAQRVLWIVYPIVWAGMMGYIHLIRPLRMLRRPYEIVEVIPERGQSYTLRLAPVGHRGIRFHPGQMAWLTLKSSPFWIQEHPFSFASSAERTETIDFAIKELGDMTAQVKDLPPGHRVYMDGPFGVFGIDRRPAPGYVFIAGGIGITPLLSMLRTMADRGDKTPVIFFYGNPTWESTAFREEIETLGKILNLKTVHVLEKPPDDWEGERGFITRDILDRHLPEDRRAYHYFLCGPLPMIYVVERHLLNLDIPLRAIVAERYQMA
jgi:predicted ferric reductase